MARARTRHPGLPPALTRFASGDQPSGLEDGAGSASRPRSVSGSPSTRTRSASLPAATRPRSPSSPSSRAAALEVAAWIAAIARRAVLVEQDDLAPDHVGGDADLARVGAGRERDPELDRGLGRGAMAALDEVLALALDRGQAGQRPVDVGDDQGRARGRRPTRPAPRSRRDRRARRARRWRRRRRGTADGLGVLGVAHDLDAELGGGLDDRPQLVLGQLRRAVDHPARREAGRREHGRLRGDDLDHVRAVADDAARGRRRAPPARPPRARTRSRARR